MYVQEMIKTKEKFAIGGIVYEAKRSYAQSKEFSSMEFLIFRLVLLN